MRTENKEGA